MVAKQQIRDALHSLRDDYGVIAVKAEFEAEGARKDELIMLGEFINEASLGFIIKIGGCEAVHDLDQCKLLGATGIMAPMIETPFALSKFKGAVQKVYKDKVAGIEKIINAETRTCLANFDSILSEGAGFLTGVTVGRSDLSASMGIERSDMEGEAVTAATETLLTKAKAAGLTANFGGNIGIESIPTIIKLNHIIDRFETRKVVLAPSDDASFLKKAIGEALHFELLYLQFKSEYYMSMAKEDTLRIERMKKQLAKVTG